MGNPSLTRRVNRLEAAAKQKPRLAQTLDGAHKAGQESNPRKRSRIVCSLPAPLSVGEFLFDRLHSASAQPTLHPVLADLWRQVVIRYWYCGDPKAGALFEAIYVMSRCASFRGGGAMRTRYSVAGLKAIYGQTPPDASPALIELRRWRQRADELIHTDHVADGLDLISIVSELTREYRRTRRLSLSPGDRLKLMRITLGPDSSRPPVQPELVGEVSRDK